MRKLSMNLVAYTSVRIMALVMIVYSSAAQAELVERDWNEDPNSTEPHCMIFSKASYFHEYKNIKSVSSPKAEDLGEGKLFKGGIQLLVNRYFCERFFSGDPLNRFISRGGNFYWYDKNEFYHESEAISIDQWRTRYIYSKSSPSYVGSHLMMPEEEVALDRLLGFDAYMISDRYETLLQFSDDGYYYDRKDDFRWRLMYMPNFKLGDHIHSADRPHIILIDESGRYLPRGGLPRIGGLRYAYSCGLMDNGSLSCGYGLKDTSSNPVDVDDDSLNYNGPIRDISPGFTPMKIESDRVTITRRLSHGEKFWLDDHHEIDVTNLFFYADFDDPIRPVYFAPGVLLRDHPKGYERAPRKEDFINREVCLTDCPSDTEWQLSGIRKRIEAHP